MVRFSKDQVKAFVKDNNLKTMDDVQSALKELLAETLQSMLEAGLTQIGYIDVGQTILQSNDTENWTGYICNVQAEKVLEKLANRPYDFVFT